MPMCIQLFLKFDLVDC